MHSEKGNLSEYMLYQLENTGFTVSFIFYKPLYGRHTLFYLLRCL